MAMQGFQSAGVTDPTMPRRTAYLSVAVLTLVYVLNFIDRKLPFILIESIKADLRLTDTQIGLIAGVVFSLVYTLSAMPLASLAERRGRKRVIAISVAFWSLMTAAGGFATNFWQLALSRIGVALGEAGASPQAHSLIASYYPGRGRGAALAVFAIGAPLGIFAGLGLGGVINDLANWRTAMIAVGLPGLLIAGLVWVGVHDPGESAKVGERRLGLIDGLRLLWCRKSFRHLAAAAVLFGSGVGASAAFTPAFLMRRFELSASDVGLAYGLVVGLAGIVGALVGGFVTDKIQDKGAGWALRVFAVAICAAAPIQLAAWWMPGYLSSLAFIAWPEFLQMMYYAPSFFAMQLLLPASQRALASAVFLFFVTGVGMSVGPFLAGLLSDLFRERGASQALAIALSVMTLTKIWTAVHYWRASQFLADDAADVARSDEMPSASKSNET